MWVYVAILAGSVIVSQHPTEEACLGRKALHEKEKMGAVVGRCVDFGGGIATTTGCTMWTTPTGGVATCR